jgi:hypothetical protein
MDNTPTQDQYKSIPPTGSPDLPFTGFDVGILLMGAVMFVALGAMLRKYANA